MLPTDLDERKQKLDLPMYEVHHKVSPHYEAVLPRIRQDCIQYNFKLTPQDFVRFCAYSFPLLNSEDFYVAASLNLFLWESDDCLDNPRVKTELKSNMLRSLYAATSSKLEPYTSCGDYFLHFVDKIRCRSLRDKLLHEYRLYLDNVKKYLGDLNRVLDPDEYAEFRRVDTCCSFSFLLMFLDVDDFRPHLDYLETKTGGRMWSLAIENCAIVNDVLSVKKDKNIGSKLNYVFSWMEGFDLTEDEAVDELLGRARHCLDELIELKNQDLGPVGTVILDRLVMWVCGHVVSTISIPRYD